MHCDDIKLQNSLILLCSIFPPMDWHTDQGSGGSAQTYVSSHSWGSSTHKAPAGLCTLEQRKEIDRSLGVNIFLVQKSESETVPSRFACSPPNEETLTEIPKETSVKGFIQIKRDLEIMGLQYTKNTEKNLKGKRDLSHWLKLFSEL